LKEGKRDEYGMEEMDGMFSSPEKSPTKFNFNSGNETIIGSEGMSIDEGQFEYQNH
jgi:centromere protein C